MTIHFHRNLSNIRIEDLYTLAILMEDDNEPKRIVFTMSYYLLSSNSAIFFVVEDNGNNVGYGLLLHGSTDPDFRKLKYFAIKREYRNHGLGTEAMKLLIKEDVKITAGFNLACSERNRSFYKRLGFVEVKKDNNHMFYNDDYIPMNLYDPKVCNIEAKGYGDHADLQLDDTAALPTYKALENEFNIELLPRS